MDKKDLSVLSIGLLAAAGLAGAFHTQAKEEQIPEMREEAEKAEKVEFIKPGILLSEFQSNKYKIRFKYPKEWTKNPRYEDKYEGKTGFFEVGDFSGLGETLDEAVNLQINEVYKPYGDNPIVRKFIVDDQPARVIYPSDDQSEFYKDREAAIVAQYPKPILIDNKLYKYVVIWVTKAYVPLILSTLKFTE